MPKLVLVEPKARFRGRFIEMLAKRNHNIPADVGERFNWRTPCNFIEIFLLLTTSDDVARWYHGSSTTTLETIQPWHYRGTWGRRTTQVVALLDTPIYFIHNRHGETRDWP